MKKVIWIMLLSLFLVASVGVQAYAADVYIPDANFKKFLLDNYDTNADDEIQDTEAAAVVGDMETPFGQGDYDLITDLTGIEAFDNITVLDCSLEALASLDVTGCDSLAELSCYSNQLTNLQVGTGLAYLSCDDNQLTSLGLAGNAGLLELECNDNLLTSLDVSNNLILEYFYCFNNQLASLDVSANTRLVQLFCYNNQLTSLNIGSSSTLEMLNCSSNQLTDIPDVTSCSSLVSFHCSGNYFGDDDCPSIAAIEAMGLGSFTYNPQYDGSTLDCTGPVAVTVDFNGDSIHDIALFYPGSSKWYIKDQSTPTYGTSDCIPIPGDYDGDGTTDLAVLDLTRSDGRGKWYLDGIGVFIYGLQDWIPVPGDYDGDGITDAALFDPVSGKWYVRNQFVTVYGAGGIPVPGDYDGDGITDIAVFYPSTNKWYIKDVATYTYGIADCIPVPADYDGDGSTDLAVIDTSRPDGMAKWYIRNQSVFIYGSVTDTIPVPGDYDGDGDDDPCLFYQDYGKWYCRNVGIWSYGNSDMIPLASNLATRYAISEAAGGGTVW